MSRLLFLIALCNLTHFTLKAQQISLCNQVVASSGKSVKINNQFWSYTIGETVVQTLTGTNIKVTQGFHQPELCVAVSTNDALLAALNLAVFPNPTAAHLTIRFDGTQYTALQCRVSDISGNMTGALYELNNPDGTQIDCAHWAPGIYILHLLVPGTDLSVPVRVVKL